MPTVVVHITQEGGPRLVCRIGQTRSERLAAQNAGVDSPPPQEFVCLIDTGASQSFIDRDIAKQLGMQERAITTVRTPSTDDAPAAVPVYEGCLIIPHEQMELEMGRVKFLGASLHEQGLGCILGRDVLKYVVFYWDGIGERLVLSY